jgi:hypothetical protein
MHSHEHSTKQAINSASDSAKHERLKLRRWPPHQLLRNDKIRVKLATMLSKRFFAVSELSELSLESIGCCQRFISVLKSFDLLTVQWVDGHGLPNKISAAVNANKERRSGLVSSLRKKFNLI